MKMRKKEYFNITHVFDKFRTSSSPLEREASVCTRFACNASRSDVQRV